MDMNRRKRSKLSIRITTKLNCENGIKQGKEMKVRKFGNLGTFVFGLWGSQLCRLMGFEWFPPQTIFMDFLGENMLMGFALSVCR